MISSLFRLCLFAAAVVLPPSLAVKVEGGAGDRRARSGSRLPRWREVDDAIPSTPTRERKPAFHTPRYAEDDAAEADSWNHGRRHRRHHVQHHHSHPPPEPYDLETDDIHVKVYDRDVRFRSRQEENEERDRDWDSVDSQEDDTRSRHHRHHTRHAKHGRRGRSFSEHEDEELDDEDRRDSVDETEHQAPEEQLTEETDARPVHRHHITRRENSAAVGSNNGAAAPSTTQTASEGQAAENAGPADAVPRVESADVKDLGGTPTLVEESANAQKENSNAGQKQFQPGYSLPMQFDETQKPPQPQQANLQLQNLQHSQQPGNRLMSIPGAMETMSGVPSSYGFGITTASAPFGGQANMMAANLFDGQRAAAAALPMASGAIPPQVNTPQLGRAQFLQQNPSPRGAGPQANYQYAMQQGMQRQQPGLAQMMPMQGKQGGITYGPPRAVSPETYAAGRPAAEPRFQSLRGGSQQSQNSAQELGFQMQAQMGQKVQQTPAAAVSQAGVPVPFFPPNAPPPGAPNQVPIGPSMNMVQQPGLAGQQQLNGMTWGDANQFPFAPAAANMHPGYSMSFLETSKSVNQLQDNSSTHPNIDTDDAKLPCCCSLGLSCETAKMQNIRCSCECSCEGDSQIVKNNSRNAKTSTNNTRSSGGPPNEWPPRPRFPRTEDPSNSQSAGANGTTARST